MAASENARNSQAPTPWILKKSGMPIRVKVLNSVAAKLMNPSRCPILEPARMKSPEVFVFLLDLRESRISAAT